MSRFRIHLDLSCRVRLCNALSSSCDDEGDGEGAGVGNGLDGASRADDIAPGAGVWRVKG